MTGNANLYPSTAILCIRLNSSKIHSSNNNLPLAQIHLYHCALSSFRYSMPISFLSLIFSTLSAVSIPHAAHSACACSFSYLTSNLRIQRSKSFDCVDLTDLFLTPMVVTLFNWIMNLHKVAEYLSLTIFTTVSRNETKGPFRFSVRAVNSKASPYQVKTLWS